MHKAFCRIYCKIYCDEFPDDGFNEGKLATGDEIYEFLSQQLGYATEPETEEIIPGDYALWYLATNEKFGVLGINEMISEWSFGESSWDRVLGFLHLLNNKAIITVAQYVHLISLVQEGMNSFDDMYEIPNYLKAKRDGLPWIKKQTDTKENIKQIIGTLKQSMEAQGYKVHLFGSSNQQSFNE